MAEGAARDVHHVFDDSKEGFLLNLRQQDLSDNPWASIGLIFQDLGKNYMSTRVNYGEIAEILEQLYSLSVQSIKQL